LFGLRKKNKIIDKFAEQGATGAKKKLNILEKYSESLYTTFLLKKIKFQTIFKKRKVFEQIIKTFEKIKISKNFSKRKLF